MTHEVDESGQAIHVDIDPFIPTGICRHCPRGQSDGDVLGRGDGLLEEAQAKVL